MPLNLSTTRVLLCLAPADLEAASADARRPPPLLLALGLDDVASAQTARRVAALRPDAILLARCRGVRDVQALDAALRVMEAENGLADRGIAVLADLGAEPEVFLHATSFAAASPRLSALVFDAEALAGRLGLQPEARGGDRPSLPLVHARAQVVLMAAAARLPAFDMLPGHLDGAFDIQSFAEAAARDGFAGSVARSGGQVAALQPLQSGP